MNPSLVSLQATVDSVLETLPPVWDRIRSNLRAAATEKFGITLEQFHILRHIRKGYQSVGDLAEKKQTSRSAVSQAIEVLVTKGLVTRRQESDDRRCVLLELTHYANDVLDANFAENRGWMAGKMAPLTREELGAILRAMEILKNTFTPGES
ncbi:MAG: MarR family transcriptional regulator [Rectinemataceae bacterium]|jgi:DNA-binding MarR family transcriptional regulator